MYKTEPTEWWDIFTYF